MHFHECFSYPNHLMLKPEGFHSIKGGKYKSETKAQLKTLYCLNLYKEFVPIIFGYMLPLV